MRRAAPICQPAATFPQCPCIPRHFPRARETARRGLPPASTPRCADLPPHTREIAARGQHAAGEQRGGGRARALHPSVSRPGEGLDDGARAAGRHTASAGGAAEGVWEQARGGRARALHPSVSRPGEGLDDGARAAAGRHTASAGGAAEGVWEQARRQAGAPLPAPPCLSPPAPLRSLSPALPAPSTPPLPAPPAFRPARRKNCARAVHARAVVLY